MVDVSDCVEDEMVRYGGLVWEQPAWFKELEALLADVSFNTPAFPQLPIEDNAEYGSKDPVARLFITIRNFNAKGLSREMRLVPAQGSQTTSLPPIGGSPGARKTRWDLTLGQWFSPTGGKQRIVVQINVADPHVEFYWPLGIFPITVKDKASQKLVANRRYGENMGRSVEFDLLYDSADASMQGVVNYNIAVLVREPGSSQYYLPILIDPRMANRG